MEKKHVALKPVLEIFWNHIRCYPLTAFLSACLTTSAIAVDLFIPIFYKKIVDTAAAAPEPTEVVAGTLMGLLFLTIGILFLRQILRRGGVIASIVIEPKVMNDLVQSAYAHLVKHSYRFFVNNFTGSLVRKISRLARAFEETYDRTIYDLIPISVALTGISVVLYLRDWRLGLVFVAWLLVFLTIQFSVARWMFKYNLKVAEKDSETTGVLSDAVANDVTIKTFAGEERERDILRVVSSEQMHARHKAWGVGEVVNSIQTVFMIAIEFGMFALAIHLWGKGILTIGDFILIQAYLLIVIDRLWNLTSALRKLFEAFADATEMAEIMLEPHEIIDAQHATTLTVPHGNIQFDAVDFGFHSTNDVLANFDLSIGAREKVALVGPSGAGKTTITKLILRFYDVQGGRILIDGQDIAEVTQQSLREAIAFVPQEPTLFHRTLMENIRYGRADASHEEVYEAARKAHCEEFIARTPQGYETYVGERGIKLSGGERQRIAIARAILKDAPILVLDEATSSLDSESESLIQDALKKLMEGKTVIAIAHRLSTVMGMDRIIVIEDGLIAMSGTHDELVAHEGGLYKKLWEIQAGGFLYGGGKTA